jgi:cell division protein ZapE
MSILDSDQGSNATSTRGVVAAYEQLLINRGYSSDAAQNAAIERLQLMADAWLARKSRRSNPLKKLLLKTDMPRSIWLWGGVGRGKSFLMDCYYEAVPLQRKTRLHFHEFMRGVHRELGELKGMPDPLVEVAKRVAQRYRLICFDEFHISDIADAMILERLLRALFDNGVAFVMTSNYTPDKLYPEGLHRDRVLPAIALLNQHCDLVNVDAGVDYRHRSLEKMPTFYYPLSPSASESLRIAFDAVAEAKEGDLVLNIASREIRALRRAGGVAWFDFKTLCGGPRSQTDYLEIAERFHTVVLSDVPEMGANMASEARRFVWLIDVFYDQRVKLLISAACAPEGLYTSGVMVNEFSRTVSRITEMQTAEYLAAPKRVAAGAL